MCYILLNIDINIGKLDDRKIKIAIPRLEIAIHLMEKPIYN